MIFIGGKVFGLDAKDALTIELLVELLLLNDHGDHLAVVKFLKFRIKSLIKLIE